MNKRTDQTVRKGVWPSQTQERACSSNAYTTKIYKGEITLTKIVFFRKEENARFQNGRS